MHSAPPVLSSPAGVLILGAHGRLGAALVQAFHAAGWRVVAHTRRAPGEAAARWPGVRWVQAPIDDAAALVAQVGGVDVVVHAMNPVYTRWAAEALPLLRGAMALARRLGALLMFPGNVYNFGSPMPPDLHEDSPQRPSARKGQLRVQAEAALRAAASGEDGAAPLRSVVLRAGDFFGGGAGSWFDLLIAKDLQRRGRVVYPGPLDRPHAWAYLPDLARAFVAVAEARERLALFEVLHFAGHTATGQQWVDGIERAARQLGWLGAPRPASVRLGWAPWPALRVLAWLSACFTPWRGSMARELLEMRYLWTEPHVLAGERLARLLGAARLAQISTPLDDALLQALRSAPPAAQQAAQHAADDLAPHGRTDAARG